MDTDSTSWFRVWIGTVFIFTKPGSYTHMSSITHKVVQQHEFNKCLSSIQCQVPMLLNSIKMCHANECILNISLDMWATMHPPLDITTVDRVYSLCHAH